MNIIEAARVIYKYTVHDEADNIIGLLCVCAGT